jgi:tripartite-type tricarboxylate transporter receptor subunit TctC
VFADEAHLCIIGESDTPASDKVRVLGITGEGRSSRFPNVPTLTEMGFPRIPNVTYFLNTARGTPKPIVDKLHAAAATAQKNPETRAAWQKFALEPLNMGPEAAQKLLADEAKIYADVAKRLGVEPK